MRHTGVAAATKLAEGRVEEAEIVRGRGTRFRSGEVCCALDGLKRSALQRLALTLRPGSLTGWKRGRREIS